MNRKFLKLFITIMMCIVIANLVYADVLSADDLNYIINKVPLDISSEDNGFKITLKEVAYDKRFINFKFEVDTEKDLGKYIYVGGIGSGIRMFTYDNDKRYSIYNSMGGSKTEKSAENKYIGNYNETMRSNYSDNEKTNSETLMDCIYLDGERIDYSINLDTVYAQLHIDQITYNDIETNKPVNVKGKWEFPYIKIEALDRSSYTINKEFEKENARLNIKDIELSSIHSSIVYEQNFDNTIYADSKWKDVSFKIKDDLGNTYSHTGGESTDETHYYDFNGINKDATKIILYPEVCFIYYTESDKNSEPTIEDIEEKYITFDAIEIDLSELQK